MTYVSQIFHDIEEVFCLLAFVSHRVDGLSDYQILGNLGPHVLLSLLNLITKVSGTFIVAAEKCGTADAVVSLPGDLLSPTADAVHAHTVGTWGNIDDGPICGVTIPSFTRIRAIKCFAVVEFGLKLEFRVVHRCRLALLGWAERPLTLTYLKLSTSTAITIETDINIKLI